MKIYARVAAKYIVVHCLSFGAELCHGYRVSVHYLSYLYYLLAFFFSPSLLLIILSFFFCTGNY